SFAIFLPLLLFFTFHAMYTLRRNASRTLSSRTHSITIQLFNIFNFQLRGAMLFYVIPLVFVVFAGVIDTRQTFRVYGVYAFSLCPTHILFSLNPAQFTLSFIIRNSNHREILMRRVGNLIPLKLFRRIILREAVPAITITE
ncbi:hypothetical protein PENTCL1PPCAC_16246, partial [Pristionchus entomophagus]